MLRQRKRRARARAALSSSPPPSCHTERASSPSGADDESPPPTEAHTEAASKPRNKRARRRNHSPMHSEDGSGFLMDVDVDVDIDSAIKDGIAIKDEPNERCAGPSAKRKRGAMTHRAGGNSVEVQTRNVTHHSLCSAADNRMPVVVDLVANTVTQVRYCYKSIAKKTLWCWERIA